MEIAKSDIIRKNKQCCNCYKAANLTETILSTNKVSTFKDRYILGEQLGWGRFGVIRECRDDLSGEVLACKSIAKNRLVTRDDMSSIKLEIEIMTQLSGHPNVVSLKAVYEDENYVHLLMELCAGGELFHQLEKQGNFSEHEAMVLFRHLMEVVKFFRHLMEVVKFCHENGVVHRDLKPENILLATSSTSSPIKLADFGLATYIKPERNLQGTVGSPFYIAPEVLVGAYNQAADVWSAGVILYILLSGMPPFWGKTKSRIFDAVRAANLKFPRDPWNQISASAKDLIRRMLRVDPSKRLTAAQVLAHPWMKNSLGISRELHPQDNIGCTELELGEDSLCTPPVVGRDQDYSFSDGSPVTVDSQAGESPVFTCKASFSSFLNDDSAPCTTLQQFSFKTCHESRPAEILSSVSSLPSFTFGSPGYTVDEGNISERFRTSMSTLNAYAKETSTGELYVMPTSLSLEFKVDIQKGNRKDIIHGYKASGIHSKRNYTIGIGELDQLPLIVSESIIRWASCTDIPSAASLGLSLVC